MLQWRRLGVSCFARPRLYDADLARRVTIVRDTPQVDTRQRMLAHLFQRQTHHRGQVHAMLAGTRIEAPQLDEFYCAGEAGGHTIFLRRAGTKRTCGQGAQLLPPWQQAHSLLPPRARQQAPTSAGNRPYHWRNKDRANARAWV